MRLFSRSCVAAGLTIALAASASPASAAGSVRTYAVTSTSQTPAGGAVVREVLALEQSGGASRVFVSNADGSLLVTPVARNAQGQIASASQDTSITCYNMAMNVLAHQSAQADPALVYVRFFSSVVPVALRERSIVEQGSTQTIALDGESTGVVRDGATAADAGIIINATVAARNGELAAAAFDEVHYLGSRTQVIARSTCALRETAPARRQATQT